MGTSLEQLSATYAHLLPDSADRARATLDAFLVNRAPRRWRHDDHHQGQAGPH
jgi:hypothetical protein